MFPFVVRPTFSVKTHLRPETAESLVDRFFSLPPRIVFNNCKRSFSRDEWVFFSGRSPILGLRNFPFILFRGVAMAFNLSSSSPGLGGWRNPLGPSLVGLFFGYIGSSPFPNRSLWTPFGTTSHDESHTSFSRCFFSLRRDYSFPSPRKGGSMAPRSEPQLGGSGSGDHWRAFQRHPSLLKLQGLLFVPQKFFLSAYPAGKAFVR